MDCHVKRLLRTCVFGVLSVATAQAQAQAQSNEPATDTTVLGEVMVTAQRRSESIMEVPLAVSALSQDTLSSLGVNSASELSGVVPTLQVNSAFGAVQPNFSLRGIGLSNEHNPNQSSPIGVYIDDAYIAARVAQGLQLFDLERVEVLRGPQGTLYGRNTTGGAINFISRMPSLSGSAGNFEVGYGNFKTSTVQGAFETAFTEGVSGIRFSFDYAHGDGFNKNVHASEPDANSTDSVAGRLIYKYVPNDKLDVMFKLSADTAEPTQAGVFNLGTGGVTGRPDDYNSVLDYSRTEQGLSFWEIDSARLGYNKVENQGAELVVKYGLNDKLTLTSLTSYNASDSEFTQEGTGVTSPVMVQPLDTLYGNEFKMFNQEVRLSYAGDRTKWQAGLYYGYDKDESNNYYWLFDGGANFHQTFDQTRESLAAFGQLDFALTKRLSATLGLRYTRDESTYDNYYSYLSPGAVSYTGERNTEPQYWDPAQAAAFFLGSSFNVATGQIVSGPAIHLDDNEPTYRAALSYTFDGGQIVYASYNHGYHNAAFCGQCFAGTTLDITLPETNDAYEIGTKGYFFDQKLSLALAAFWIDYYNQQTNQQIGLESRLTNVPKSRMKGVELEATAQTSQDFRFTLSVGYLDAIFEELTLGLAEVDGSPQPYAPEWTANFHFDWILASTAKGTYRFTPSVIYTSDVFYSPYGDLVGNGPLSQDANTKLNAQFVYETDNYSFVLWGENLTDEDTFGDGLDLRTFGYYYMVPLAPRTYGVKLGYKF
jgi:iron complex outermembrane receptor protein